MWDDQAVDGFGQAWSGFIGIDWSGAKGQFIAGIQMAIARPGTKAPDTILPSKKNHWSRQDVLKFLVDQAANVPAGAPLLVGIDFAFAHPFADRGSYFPNCIHAPKDAAALWRLVDKVNVDSPHFYGGEMFRHPVWGAYYLAPPKFSAPRYESRRRMTELAAKASGRSPSPTFKAVGADNVSTGSMAGMRCIHYLRQKLGAQLAVWPFDELRRRWPGVKLVLVEIFPSYYFYRVGMVPAKQAAAQADFLNTALEFYDSAGVPPLFLAKGTDADEADAIIASAALRYFAQQTTKTAFDLPDPVGLIARQEGWIFGVDPIYSSSP
ncbi:MAG: hypothetical protein VX106_04755 [Pseudomonadota bacterium]|nr:hypothetical protein [Pseudomonadota bacterium]